MFRKLFISRLPGYVQGILASMDENSPSEQLAKTADRILEAFTTSEANSGTAGRSNRCTCSNAGDSNPVASVAVPISSESETLKAIQKLTKQMIKLLAKRQSRPRDSFRHGHWRRSSRSSSRRRASPSVSDRPGIYWNHRRIGKEPITLRNRVLFDRRKTQTRESEHGRFP